MNAHVLDPVSPARSDAASTRAQRCPRRAVRRGPPPRRRPAALSWLLLAYLVVGCVDALVHRLV